MPVDLDELFDAMRRRADTIALPGAEPARQRGRRRERTQVVATIAAVVTLVAVGTAVAVRPGPFRHDWPAVPTVGRPLPLGGTATGAQLTTDGVRAYAAWTRRDDGTVWAAATDLRTGATAWSPQQLSTAGSAETLERVLVTPSAVVVVTKPRLDPPNGLRVYLLNPRTGSSNGGVAVDSAEGQDYGEEDWVFAGDQMVTMEPPSGQIAFAGVGATGYRGITSGNPAYTRVLGWGTTADEQRIGQSGPPAAFADPRVVLVTLDGIADVFDARTGNRLRRVSLGLAPGKQMAVFDGTLFMIDTRDSPAGPLRMRFVDLSGGKAGAWEAAPVPGALVAMGACGPARVCLVTSAPGRKNQITAFDVRQRRVAWQATTDVTGPGRLSAANGRTLVTGAGGFDLYDPDGRRIATGAPAFHDVWLDPQQLLVMHPEGVLARLPIGAREPKPIGRAPAGTLGCTSTSTRLACVTATAVTTWDLS